LIWPNVSIEQFCQTGSGGTPPRERGERYYGGTIPWVKSGELKDGIVLDTQERITHLAVAESSAKVVPAGAILVAMYGATVGKTAMLGIEAATNQAICFVLPDPKIADAKFVWYALRARAPHLVAARVGGAQPNISQQIIRQTKLPLPPLSEQRRIVQTLDRGDALREKRARADTKVRDILPALFIQMFNNRTTSGRNWPTESIAELVEQRDGAIRTGPFGSQLHHSEFIAEPGVPVLGIDNVVTNRFRWVKPRALPLAGCGKIHFDRERSRIPR
jgi:type I restriction enzyme S subunit